MTSTTTLRLRRVRFKDGRTIEIMRNADRTDVARSLVRTANKGLASKTETVAYALVAWFADGEVLVDYRVGPRSPFAAGQISQMAKDVLLIEQAIRWSRE